MVVSVGPGPERPWRSRVEALAGQPPGSAGAFSSRFTAGVDWPVFEGAGLTCPAAPFSSGWLAPPGRLAPEGWMGPETIQALPPTPGAGLVALGLAAAPGQDAIEKGSRVLAEASLGAGWSWTLLSRRPLTRDERGQVESRLRSWAADPAREAQRLARKDPALAASLTLWIAPPPAPAVARRDGLMLLATLGAVLLLAAIAVEVLRRRNRASPAPPLTRA
jgi:hypothetical protein